MKFFFFLLNLNIILNYVLSEQFVANLFYQDNTCEDLNFIMYSYTGFEVCEVLDQDLCNGFGTYSNKQYCDTDSLDYTKKIMNKNDFLYLEIYDETCNTKIGAVSYILNKCISFMDTVYIKITKSDNYFNSKSYLDPLCEEEYIFNSESDTDETVSNNQNNVDLNKCLDKIKVYTKDGELKINLDNFKDNKNKKQKNNSNNLTINCLLLFSIILIIIN